MKIEEVKIGADLTEARPYPKVFPLRVVNAATPYFIRELEDGTCVLSAGIDDGAILKADGLFECADKAKEFLNGLDLVASYWRCLDIDSGEAVMPEAKFVCDYVDCGGKLHQFKIATGYVVNVGFTDWSYTPINKEQVKGTSHFENWDFIDLDKLGNCIKVKLTNPHRKRYELQAVIDLGDLPDSVREFVKNDLHFIFQNYEK